MGHAEPGCGCRVGLRAVPASAALQGCEVPAPDPCPGACAGRLRAPPFGGGELDKLEGGQGRAVGCQVAAAAPARAGRPAPGKLQYAAGDVRPAARVPAAGLPAAPTGLLPAAAAAGLPPAAAPAAAGLLPAAAGLPPAAAGRSSRGPAVRRAAAGVHPAGVCLWAAAAAAGPAAAALP